MSTFVAAIISMAALGFLFAAILVIADKYLKVKEDPRLEELLEALPGSNEGACGYPSCRLAAEAIVKGEAETNVCVVGGQDTANQVAKIMGKDSGIIDQKYPVIMCQGGKEESTYSATYIGVKTCEAADAVGGGGKACLYGCLSFGDCVKSCPFDALHLNDDGLPEVDLDKCTSCAVCVGACPRGLIEMRPREEQTIVMCKSLNTAKIVKQVCKVGCVACGLCVKVCPVEAITMENNLASIDPEICNNCGDCIEKCPTKCIISTSTFVERHELPKEAVISK